MEDQLTGKLVQAHYDPYQEELNVGSATCWSVRDSRGIHAHAYR